MPRGKPRGGFYENLLTQDGEPSLVFHLEAVYVLFGAFRDGRHIIPVQMEIKKSSDVGGRLYMTVAMTKIEADVVGSTPEKIQAHSLVPASRYSLADIFREINRKDAHFLIKTGDGSLSYDFLTTILTTLYGILERWASRKTGVFLVKSWRTPR